jgi:hypothetical protein
VPIAAGSPAAEEDWLVSGSCLRDLQPAKFALAGAQRLSAIAPELSGAHGARLVLIIGKSAAKRRATRFGKARSLMR